MQLGCVVMAAGAGTRFAAEAGEGANKLLADVCGEPLVARTVRSVSPAFEVVVVTRDADVAAAARAAGARVVEPAGPGRSDSVRAGLAAGGARWDGCLFLSGDQPCVVRASFDAFATAGRLAPERCFRLCCAGVPAGPVLFPARLFASLEALHGSDGGRSVLRAEREVGLIEATSSDELVDVDRPRDLERVRAIWARREGHTTSTRGEKR